jgi:putative endonuclease
MEILKIKTRNRRVGDIGEREAVKLLKRKKFKIIERNYVAVNHEIDIIAENKEYQIFVEVKCREINEDALFDIRPADAVTPDKQRAIVRAASYYTGFNPSDKKKRFDVIEVYVKSEGSRISVVKTNHIEGAFTKNDAYKVKRD